MGFARLRCLPPREPFVAETEELPRRHSNGQRGLREPHPCAPHHHRPGAEGASSGLGETPPHSESGPACLEIGPGPQLSVPLGHPWPALQGCCQESLPLRAGQRNYRRELARPGRSTFLLPYKGWAGPEFTPRVFRTLYWVELSLAAPQIQLWLRFLVGQNDLILPVFPLTAPPLKEERPVNHAGVQHQLSSRASSPLKHVPFLSQPSLPPP